MNLGIQTFVYAEYLSVAAAKVWKGLAKLPTRTEMWKLYWDRVAERGGHGKAFQLLGEKKSAGKYCLLVLPRPPPVVR